MEEEERDEDEAAMTSVLLRLANEGLPRIGGIGQPHPHSQQHFYHARGSIILFIGLNFVFKLNFKNYLAE